MIPAPPNFDFRLDSVKPSVPWKFIMIILPHLMTTNHRKRPKSKYDRKLPELDVVTMRILYRGNGGKGGSVDI